MVVLSQLREREHRLLLHVVGVSAGKGERGGEREGEREGERRTPRPYQEGTIQKGAVSHAISMHVYPLPGWMILSNGFKPPNSTIVFWFVILLRARHASALMEERCVCG